MRAVLFAGCHSVSLAARLQHICDAVVAVKAVRDDSSLVSLVPESASVCGLLQIRKLPRLNILARQLPAIDTLIIRHKRRRLALEAIDIDPDAEAALGNKGVALGADGTGNGSLIASLCGGIGMATTALDF